jgi:RNA polymerase sigma factor (sigma-70 family)
MHPQGLAKRSPVGCARADRLLSPGIGQRRPLRAGASDFRVDGPPSDLLMLELPRAGAESSSRLPDEYEDGARRPEVGENRGAGGWRVDRVADSLLGRVAQGDATAMQECIDCYGGLVWSLARRLLLNPIEAEDAVQEIFIELWKNAGRFDSEIAAEQTFVAMIARRRLIDRRRRQSRRLDRAQAVPVDEIDIESDFQGPEQVEMRDGAEQAAEALRQLRPEQQRVLRLSVYEGWSHQRIADHLGMPLGSVKTHVRRGLIRIREMLARRESARAGEVTP